MSFSKFLNAPNTLPSCISSASGYEFTMSSFMLLIAADLSDLFLMVKALVILSEYFSVSSA